MTIVENTSHPWFGIQAHLRKEKIAAMQLEGRGYEVYLPQYRKRTNWSDRRIEVDCALFPGYLFCRFDSRLPPIVTVPCIVSIVGRGREPEPIPEHEIANIQNMLQSGFMVTPYPYLQVGQRVIIVKGPLRGLDGFLITNKKKCNVVVSVTLLQRSVAVECDPEAVQPIDGGPAHVGRQHGECHVC
jgi:transcriptional antiterminator NusG